MDFKLCGVLVIVLSEHWSVNTVRQYRLCAQATRLKPKKVEPEDKQTENSWPSNRFDEVV